MDEQMWNIDALDDVLDFSVDVIEFFKNDYLSIKIFLAQESVWDRNLMLKLSLSNDELVESKHKMLKNIVMAYYSMLQEIVIEPDNMICKVDYPFMKLLNSGLNPVDIFVNENFCSEQMLRHYITLIQDRRTIRIDTYNNFQTNIMDFVSIYTNNYQIFEIDKISERVDALDDKKTQQKYIAFYRSLVKNVKDYIPNHFRNTEEESDFINYVFSLFYTDLIKKRNKSEELESEELKVIDFVESDSDLVEVFDFNPSIVILILEYLYNTYQENGLEYDCRKEVCDKNVQDCLRALDDNFDTKFEPDIIISDYTVDNKLSVILDSFDKNGLSSLDIYQLLLDHTSIYYQLYQVGLDARYSDFYKRLMIRKILSDVFEFESYLKVRLDNNASLHYDYLKSIKLNWENLLNYFVDKGTFLIESYYNYHIQSKNFSEKARLHIYRNNELKIIDQINLYSAVNYFAIMLGKLKELPSVDYINRMLDAVRNGQHLVAHNQETLDYVQKLVQAMCLNVYEHLVVDDNNIKNVKEICHIIENESNILLYLLNNKNVLDYIAMLFIHYNKEAVSYDSELKLRSRINDEHHIKVLKRINPFDKEDNNKKFNDLK